MLNKCLVADIVGIKVLMHVELTLTVCQNTVRIWITIFFFNEPYCDLTFVSEQNKD